MIPAPVRHWAVGEVREAREIHPGRVWRVACADGSAFILKDIGAGPDVERRFAFERDVLRHLQRAGVGVALPVPDRRGAALVAHEERLYTLSPYLATDNRWPELDLEGLLRLNRNCGAAIARLHAALATYPTRDLAQRTWRTVLPDEWFERSMPVIRQALPAPERTAFDRMLQAAEGEMRRPVEGEMRRAVEGLPEQLIHRDCHHGNIVVHGEQVSGFVDCDHLSLGPRVLDLADFLVHMVKGRVADQQATEQWFALVPAVLEGYQGENPLSGRERRAVYAMMLGILLMFAAWFYETGTPQHAPRELETLAWMVEQRARICQALES